MKYKSQKVAYWFFALSMLLLVLQIVYGFIMGFARIGFDNLHEFIPFNTAYIPNIDLNQYSKIIISPWVCQLSKKPHYMCSMPYHFS